MDLKEFMIELYEIKGVKFGDFVTKIGINSPVYFDLRVIISYPRLMDKVASLLHQLIDEKKQNYDQICGVPYTALPIATLISVKAEKPMVIRRKETKSYGTKKLIEGNFHREQECIIIEDVVTSGSSIADTVKDLKKEGLVVKEAFVILDRQQGGRENLEKEGIKMTSLFTLTDVLNILKNANRITEETVNNVNKYVSKYQINVDGSFKNQDTKQSRTEMTFEQRRKLTKNPVAVKIFEIMEEKETMLCFAADVSDGNKLIHLAEEVGEHICILKTHVDGIQDFDESKKEKLSKLAKDYNFLIMEDRKFADIGNTVSLTYSKIYPWADLITVHSLTGENVLLGLKEAVRDNSDRGCFLVAELSCEGSLITKEYTNETLKMGKKHLDFVVGFVCQSPDLIKEPHLLQLTPGIKLEDKTDNLGQNYNDPEYAVLHKGADIGVVGRGIIQSNNPASAAKNYKERLWNAYLDRVKDSLK